MSGDILRRLSAALCILSVALGASAGLALHLDERARLDGSVTVSGDVDLGAVDRDAPCRFAMTVRNGRNEAAVIDRVSSTCGCTDLMFDRQRIEPGETMRVTGSVDTSVAGTRVSSVYVSLQGEDTPRRVGTMRALVRAGWTATQTRVTIRLDRGGDRFENELRLTSDDVVVPTTVSCSTDLDFLEASGELSGRVLRVRLRPRAGSIPIGRYEACVVVRSDSRAAPLFRERVIVEYQPERLQTEPPVIVTPLFGTGTSTAVSFRPEIDRARASVTDMRILDRDVARLGSWRQEDDGRIVAALVPGPGASTTTRARILVETSMAPFIVEAVVAAGGRQ